MNSNEHHIYFSLSPPSLFLHMWVRSIRIIYKDRRRKRERERANLKSPKGADFHCSAWQHDTACELLFAEDFAKKPNNNKPYIALTITRIVFLFVITFEGVHMQITVQFRKPLNRRP